MATVGAVWINVLPSMQGFASNLQKQATSAAKVAAVGAGTSMGNAMGDATVGALAKKMTANSKRMQATFTGSTNVMTRSLANFRAGFRDVDAAASAFTGRMGTLGGATARGLRPGVQAIGGFAAGFGNADAAASAFSGRAGALGGVVRRGLDPAVVAAQNLHSGFTNSAAAASAFTGRMGSLGGVARTALQPGITAVQGISTGLQDAGTTAVSAFSTMRSGAATAFSGVGTAVSSVATAGSGAADQIAGFFSGAATRAADSIRNVLGGAIGQVGAMLGVIGLGALGSQIASVASGAATTEAQLTALYGAAGGGAAEVTALMDGMNERFRGLDMTAMRSGAVSLAYMGLQGEEAVGVLERLEKATTATGSGTVGMDRAMAALTKGVNSGKFQMVELNQISDAGIPIYDALADVLGVDIPTAQQMATDGAIGLEEVLAALSGDHGTWFPALIEGAENMDRTFSGAWDTIKNTIVNGFAEELVPLFDRAAPVMLNAADAIGEGFERLPGIVDRVREVFSGLMEATGLDRLGGFLAETIIPALRDLWVTIQPLAVIVGGALVVGFRLVMEALYALGPILTSVTGWLAENRKWVTLVGVAILGGVAAYYALGAASAIIRTITSVTRIWAVAQGALNAVMAMNPITLIVIAIGALVAGIIYAYKNFEGFRNLIDTVWQAIKTAALWIWDNGLKPAFEGISAGAQAVGGWFVWLWENAIQPAFNFIESAVRLVAGIILFVLVAPIVIAVKAMGAIFSWLWDVVISPVFAWIGALATWLWNNAIKPAWDGIMVGVRAVGAIFSWLWGRVKAVFNWVAAHIQNWWTRAQATFQRVVGFVRGALSNAFNWFKDRVIRPVWDWISGHINRIWDNGIKPAFEKVMEGVDWLKDAFDSGKEAIADAWEGIKDSAKTPINFLIDTVFNDGIRPLWNKVAGVVGADELDKVATFATGGAVFGSGTATSDSIPALLSNGEHVWTAAEVRAAGGHAAVEAIRASALDGGSTYRAGGQVAFPGAPSIPSPARLLQAIGDFLSPSGLFSAVTDLISGDYESAIDGVLKPARDITSEIGTEGLPGTPYLIVEKGGELLKEKVTELVDAYNAAVGAGGGSTDWVGLASASQRLQNAAAFADRQHGKPYQWGGVGNPSFDCSGFTGSIERVIRGVNPRARQHTTHSFQGTPPAGWVRNLRSPYMVGVRHGGRGGGHMAGTLLGKNVESGGRGVVTGPRAQGAGSFPHRFGFQPVVGDTGGGGGSVSTLYDRGGYVQPGTTLVSNQSGRPEPVLTAAQWRDIHQLAASVGASEGGELMRDAHIHLENSEATVQEAFRRLDTELRKRRRGGVHAGRVGR